MPKREKWIAGVVNALAGGAIVEAPTRALSPRPKIERASSASKPGIISPAHPPSGGQVRGDTHPLSAAGNPVERAISTTAPEARAPAHAPSGGPPKPETQPPIAAGNPIARARKKPNPKASAPVQPPSGGPLERVTPEANAAGNPVERATLSTMPIAVSPAHPPSGGQASNAPPKRFAAGNPVERAKRFVAPNDTPPAQSPSGGQPHRATPLPPAAGNPLNIIVERWRWRQDMLRARQRLELQAKAICRRLMEGDKVAGAKLYQQVIAADVHPLRAALDPFLVAMEPLGAAKRAIERDLEKQARELSIFAWAESVRGLGALSLAGIIGECAIGPGDYRNPSALWKRMGLAVIAGGRQRRVTGADALEHGYNAERRSLMWNIGGAIMKAQLRAPRDDDGKRTDGETVAIGPLGQLYLDRKAYLIEREAGRDEPWTPMHIHNDAKRYVEKRLLRSLWQEWRRAIESPQTRLGVPAVIPAAKEARA
jgi:hypothetical protein